MKRTVQLLTLGILVIGIVACSFFSKTTENKQIVLGSTGSDAQIWKFIAQSKAAKDEHLNIVVKEINDGVALNNATLENEIDVNAFQSWGYFKVYNQAHQQQLQAIATTYLEPMGLYSKKYKSLKDLPTGASVVIPSDPANTVRALKLLQKADLIQLTQNFNALTGNVQDIVSNPKQLKITLVQGGTAPRALTDVDLVAIGNTDALESGLDVTHDALFYEKVDQSVGDNINILVVNKQKAQDPDLLKLAKLYHQPFVKDYIQKHFKGTKIDVNQPLI
ncbi:MetQ/NlpA family ABC transporter substrate-binding protein [Acinetobacter sp. HY1485]|uniref:MetQ/NlpA family ABC transporter substrate-binding protein n=1 Tax=Acinetobacter sp. HY1485 TaxID=2970918 RepID=UPI0022B9CED6|nr:MetQ/NlpA family ABC transporter substrate-binding protein [Acinetobacter sp. HY1485]